MYAFIVTENYQYCHWLLYSYCIYEQEAFEKCWAHSLFYIAIHQVSLLSHDACAIDVHNNDDDDNDNA